MDPNGTPEPAPPPPVVDPAPPPPVVEPAPPPPVLEPAPPPPVLEPAPPPPVVEPACVETADYGCVEIDEYEARLRTIEDAHRAEAGFTNQWGLGAVRADRAWAQVELEHGAGTAPGAGITLGAIDTGIDARPPRCSPGRR